MKRMKRVLEVWLALCLLLSLFSGCKREGGDEVPSRDLTGNSSAASQPGFSGPGAEEKALSGKLVISALMDLRFAGINPYVEGFQKKYPRVEVEVEYGLTTAEASGDSEAYYAKVDQYLQRLATELMGGDAPDVIEADIFPMEKYAASGLLTDLYRLMEKDGLSKEDYFENVLKAYEYESGLYKIPISFSMDYAVLHKQALEAAGAEVPSQVDYASLLDLYFAARESGKMPALKSVDDGGNLGKNLNETLEFPLYIDFSAKQASFTSSEFQEYLEKTQQYDTGVSLLDSALGGSNDLDGFAAAGDSVAMLISLKVDCSDWLNCETEEITNALPVVNSQGQLSAVSAASLAIPGKGGNEQLAWEFVKYCLEASGSAEISDGFPLRRENCREFLETNFESDGLYDQISAAIEQVNARPFGDQVFLRLIHEELSKFYDQNLLTSEECAVKIQEKAEIYLKE